MTEPGTKTTGTRQPGSLPLPLQLDIMVTTKCNASCKCCIQEVTFRPEVGSQDLFLRSLSTHFTRFYERGGRKVVITGGEPLLEHALVLKVLASLRPFAKLELKGLYTNGSLLLDIGSDGRTTLAAALAAAGLSSVGLSIHHHRDDVNNQLLCLPHKSSTADIVAELKRCALPFRFNLVLQHGGISNADDLLAYVDKAFAFGATDVYVREMTDYTFDEPLWCSSRGARDYARSHRVNAQRLGEELKTLRGIEYVGSRTEAYRDKCEMEFRHLGSGRRFYLSSLVVGSEKRDGVPYLVLMPNGKLYRGWLGECDEFSIT